MKIQPAARHPLLHLADTPVAIRLAVLAWRLGLGWLVGRWLVLVTTTPDTGSVRRSIAPYVFGGGNLYVSTPGAAAWLADIERRPQVMAQAAPGPLGVRARALGPDESEAVHTAIRRSAPVLLATGRVVTVLEPSGERPPEIVPPDLNWVGPLAVAVGLLIRRLRRR